jgi:hypothetical protein
MYTIEEVVGRQSQGIGHEDFERRLIEVCRDHRRDRRALIFAFLVYDFSNPGVIKVLRDADYWEALDQISGKSITVFSLHSPEVENRPPDGWERAMNGKIRRFLKDQFEVDETTREPGIIFFQVVGERVIDSYLVQLREQKQEDAFNEVREIIQLAADSLADVSEEYRGNAQEQFYLVQERLAQRRLVKRVTRGSKLASSVQSIAKAIAGFHP